MLFGMGSMLYWVVGDAGGVASLTQRVLEVRPDAVVVPAPHAINNWLSSTVLLGLASVVYPQAIQRVFAARSGLALKRSLALMSFMPLATTGVVFLIGIAAIPRFAGLGDVEADRVTPLLLASWAESGNLAKLGALVVFIGALAAIMSTADSVLLSLSSICAKDFSSGQRPAAEETRLGKRIALAVMLVMATSAALYRDITLWRLIELKMELLVQAVPVFMLALHWKRLHRPCPRWRAWRRACSSSWSVR